MSRKHLVPIVGRDPGDRYDLSATPNTAVAIAIPGTLSATTRPAAASVFFLDGAGAFVHGRYIYAGNNALNGNAGADDDAILGRFPPFEKEIPVPHFATHLVVASNTASAKCYVTWLYEV